MNEAYDLIASKSGYYDKGKKINLTPEGEFVKKEEVLYIDPSP